MNELALFAGGGGGLLGGLLLGWRTVCYVERDDYCQQIIQQRIRDGILHDAPIWGDVRTFDGRPWAGSVDVVTAGFPCQPFSLAGKQRGSDDERNCWPDTIRIIREVRPRFALLENVPALLTSGYFGRVLGDLAKSGLNAEWGVLGASRYGAHFPGQRLWVLASSPKAGGVRRGGGRPYPMGTSQWGLDQFTRLVQREVEHGVPTGSLERISDGVSKRVDRLRAVGNAQVPIVVVRAWHELSGRLEG